ncbi:hypothetical protein GK047_28305 [Paenibacillus sp. SYP-B3998]|uniref:Uncharacterized protein n=1 Tax=Paenibacillus sp. SYP-B3998 TaxID=2678564 RepID=A0A6G4A5N5_9BACL|nr:hypothetical protein [Paenibacillus sp. SYP-B3998]NEW09826.1 hypothetical protein [Paenibacillus sp. SYP-B3998]
MQRIYPITEKSCNAQCGKPVLVFLHDGLEIYGVLSRVEKEKLILNDQSSSVSSSTTKKSAKVKTKKTKAKTQALEPSSGANVFPSYGLPFFGGLDPSQRFEIEMGSVAALFS